MLPLFGEAGGWGGALEALACMFGCVELLIVGLAVTGAILRSPVLVGLSFVPVLATFVMVVPLSEAGCLMLAIMLLAPGLAVCSLLPKRPPHVADGTAAPAVPSSVDADPVPSGFFVVKLFTLCLLVLVAFILVMR